MQLNADPGREESAAISLVMWLQGAAFACGRATKPRFSREDGRIAEEMVDDRFFLPPSASKACAGKPAALLETKPKRRWTTFES